MPLQLVTSAARGRPIVVLQEDSRPRFRADVGGGQDMSFILALMNSISQQNLANRQIGLQETVAKLQGMVTEESLRSGTFTSALNSSLNPMINDLSTKESLAQADFTIKTDDAVNRGAQSAMAKFAAISIRSIGDRFDRREIEEGIIGIPEKVKKVLASSDDPFVQMGMAQRMISSINTLASSPNIGAEGQKLLASVVQRGLPGLFTIGDPSFPIQERSRMAAIRQREFTEHFVGVKAEAQRRINTFRGEDPSLPAIKREIPRIAEEVISSNPFKPPEIKPRFPSEVVREEFTLPPEEGAIPSLTRALGEIPERLGRFGGGRSARRIAGGRVLGEGSSGTPLGEPVGQAGPFGPIFGSPISPGPGMTPPSGLELVGPPTSSSRILAEEVPVSEGLNRPMTDEEFDMLLNEGRPRRSSRGGSLFP